MFSTRNKLTVLFYGCMRLIVLCRGQVETASEANDEELLIDRRGPPTAEERLQLIAQELPSLALDFYERHKYDALRLSENCAVYPDIFQLQYHNNYWQVYRNDDLTFYLYAAYYDKRPLVQLREGGAVLVRILAMVNAIDYQFADYPTSYCQLWFDEQTEPLIVPVREYRQLWYSAWGDDPQYYYATFVECAMPSQMRRWVPQTVSLVRSGCERATNNLRVVYEPTPINRTQRGFAVCSTGLYNPYRDNSVRLVEWLELLRLLGAEHVMLPTFGIHPNATKVLRHYEREGFVSAPYISLVRGEPALPHFTNAAIEMSLQNHRLNEMIPLNDCLYRSMYKYEYVVVLDVDEVIMPLGAQRSWTDLVHYAKAHIRSVDCESFTSLCFRNVYFPAYPARKPYSAVAPSYMYMLQHVARVAQHSAPLMSTKCFHNTSTVTGVHNHYPMHWTGGCGMQSVNETAGQLQHYREPEIPETLANPVIDDVIWRYKETLVARTQAVLRELGLLRRKKMKSKDPQRAEEEANRLKDENVEASHGEEVKMEKLRAEDHEGDGKTPGKTKKKKEEQVSQVTAKEAIERTKKGEMATVRNTETPPDMATTSKRRSTKAKKNEL